MKKQLCAYFGISALAVLSLNLSVQAQNAVMPLQPKGAITVENSGSVTSGPTVQTAPTTGERMVTCSDKNNFVDNAGSATQGLQLGGDGPTGGFRAIAMRFPDFTGRVTGLYFDGENIGSNAGVVELVIWSIDGNGEPGNILSNGTNVTINQNLQEWGGPLDSPANVSNGCFAMIWYTEGSADSMLIDINPNNTNSSEDRVFVREYDGTYLSLQTDFVNGFRDIKVRPVLEFDYEAQASSNTNTICDGDQVSFTNNTSLPVWFDDPIYNNASDVYEWDFKDGNTSNQENPTHTFNGIGSGNIDVTLKAIFEGYSTTCSDSDIVSLSGSPGPNAFWTYQTVGLSAEFFAASLNEDTYSWNFGDGNTSNSPNPINNYAMAAFYTVELTTTNSCGNDFKTFNIQVSDTANFGNVGIEDITQVLSMSLFPNPANNQLSVELELDRTTQVTINVYNSIGQLVEQSYTGQMRQDILSIDLTNYEKGVYFLQVITPENNFSKPFIKK